MLSEYTVFMQLAEIHRGISTFGAFIYHVRKSDYTYSIAPVVGFDWYVTGYCVSHFDLRWGLEIYLTTKEKAIDLLVKGLKSAPIAKGRIYDIIVHDSELSLFQIFHELKEFCQLQSLVLWFIPCHDEDSMAVLRQLIAPESGLRKLNYLNHPVPIEGYISSLIPLLLDKSSLEELVINYGTYERIEHLPRRNTNLKKLFLSTQLIRSLEALLPNITSLTCLKITGCSGEIELNVLTKTVQSLPTLQILELQYVGYYSNCDGGPLYVSNSLLQLIEAAGNSQLKELIISEKCFSLLPSKFQEHYRHLLKCKQDAFDFR